MNIDERRREIAIELRGISDEWRKNGIPQTLDGVVYPLFEAFHAIELDPCDAFDLIAYCVEPACEAVDREAI